MIFNDANHILLAYFLIALFKIQIASTLHFVINSKSNDYLKAIVIFFISNNSQIHNRLTNSEEFEVVSCDWDKATFS